MTELYSKQKGRRSSTDGGFQPGYLGEGTRVTGVSAQLSSQWPGSPSESRLSLAQHLKQDNSVLYTV